MLLLLLALATVSSGYRFRLLDYGSATFSQSVCLNATATYDEVLANNTCATPVLLNPIVGYVYTIETPWLVNTSFPGVRFDVSTASCNGPSQNGPADVPYGFAVNLAPSLLGKCLVFTPATPVPKNFTALPAAATYGALRMIITTPISSAQFATVNSIWSLLTGFPFVQISSSSGNATTLTSEFNGASAGAAANVAADRLVAQPDYLQRQSANLPVVASFTLSGAASTVAMNAVLAAIVMALVVLVA